MLHATDRIWYLVGVLEGLETVSAIAAVPTFSPNASARQVNSFARFSGDGRAAKARGKWDSAAQGSSHCQDRGLEDEGP